MKCPCRPRDALGIVTTHEKGHAWGQPGAGYERKVDTVEDGCCPFKIVFDEDFNVHFICILLCFKYVLGSA